MKFPYTLERGQELEVEVEVEFSKESDEFAVKRKSPELRTTICRECQRAYGREHYRQNKEEGHE